MSYQEKFEELLSRGKDIDELYQGAEEAGEEKEFLDQLKSSRAGSEAGLHIKSALVSLFKSRSRKMDTKMLWTAVTSAFVVSVPYIVLYLLSEFRYAYSFGEVLFKLLPFLLMVGSLPLLWKRISPEKRASVVPAASAAALLIFVFVFFTQRRIEFYESSQVFLNTLLFLPIVFGGIFGLLMMQKRWKDPEKRFGYLLYMMRWGLLFALCLAAGSVIIGLGFALFSLIGVDEDILRYILFSLSIYGSFLAFFGGVFLLEHTGNPPQEFFFGEKEGNQGMEVFLSAVSVMAAVLFFVLFIFAAARAISAGAHDFFEGYVFDRDFLGVLSGSMILVMLISVSGILNRSEEPKFVFRDGINLTLLFSAVLVDVLALLGVAVRLVRFGFTVNRFVLITLNLLVLVHLILILVRYLAFLKKKSSAAAISELSGKYLSAYFLYSVLVAIFIPIFSTSISLKPERLRENIFSEDFESLSKVVKEVLENPEDRFFEADGYFMFRGYLYGADHVSGYIFKPTGLQTNQSLAYVMLDKGLKDFDRMDQKEVLRFYVYADGVELSESDYLYLDSLSRPNWYYAVAETNFVPLPDYLLEYYQEPENEPDGADSTELQAEATEIKE